MYSIFHGLLAQTVELGNLEDFKIDTERSSELCILILELIKRMLHRQKSLDLVVSTSD